MSVLFSFDDDTRQTSVNTHVREVDTDDDDASICIIIFKLWQYLWHTLWRRSLAFDNNKFKQITILHRWPVS
jgi:hypothetical protein